MKRKRIGRIILASALAAVLTAAAAQTAFAAPSTPGFEVEDLTLQPGTDTTQINLNWYTDTDGKGAKVKFSDGKNTITQDAFAKSAVEGKTACKATVSELAPDTEYTYSISEDGGATWSKEYKYTTPAEGEFTFGFVGDPQLNNGSEDKNSAVFSSDKTTKTGWNDTLNALADKNVDLIASAGDQVDDTKGGSEAQYTELFSSSVLRSTPFAAAVGNHDRHNGFLYHYNLPNEQDVSSIVNSTTTAAAQEVTTDKGNYFYKFNNALFVVLNDSSYPSNTEEAKPYIEAYRQTLSNAVSAYPDYRWLFVQHHKSTESVAQHVADRDIQYYVETGFEKLMDEFKVDVVLAGHDHVYARTYAMSNGKRVSDLTNSYVDPEGTVYLTCNTGSGLKYYNIFDTEKLYVKDNEEYPYLANGLKGSQEYLKGVFPLSTAVAQQDKIPGYTTIKVTDEKITFNSYSTYDNPATADINEATDSIDTFTITKSTPVTPTEPETTLPAETETTAPTEPSTASPTDSTAVITPTAQSPKGGSTTSTNDSNGQSTGTTSNGKVATGDAFNISILLVLLATAAGLTVLVRKKFKN
ncbi:MAG: metallophosphoesterase [bacterium]|nr:metallophosphoesterase [bacterium]